MHLSDCVCVTMKIIQITPAGRKSKSGNRTTADRWTRLLRNLGHRVETFTEYDGRPADMMVAIHAWRSADAIAAFKAKYPDRPLVLCLGGTDINQYIHTHPVTTLRSMEQADAMVCLHDLIKDITPKQLRRKLKVIYQSAKPLPRSRSPSGRHFDICLVGHMREVKDPMRTALAVRGLPEYSRIQVRHFGMAHNEKAAKTANAEMKRNARYHRLGEVPGWKIRQEFLRTQAMVITSTAEGGANVVSEAIVGGVPVIASDIDGNIGLLGRRYGGYYKVGDEGDLQTVLLRAENDPKFLSNLTRQVEALAPKFVPEREQESWRELIEKLT